MTQYKRDYSPEAWEKILAKNRERSKTPFYRQKDKARYTPERKDMICASARLRRYGITQTQVDDLLFIQGFRCPVCNVAFDFSYVGKRHQHVDHCHTTKRVRGILCSRCNVAEGYIRSLGMSPVEFARSMEAYLANPPAFGESFKC